MYEKLTSAVMIAHRETWAGLVATLLAHVAGGRGGVHPIAFDSQGTLG